LCQVVPFVPISDEVSDQPKDDALVSFHDLAKLVNIAAEDPFDYG
jgi:hypothetical protein